MLTIKLRENGKDVYTSVYPETSIAEVKQNSYPLQWSRGDTILFLFMGNELTDEYTIQQCGISEGSCIVVNFIRNEGNQTERRSAPRTFNYQYQRARDIQRNSDDFFETFVECLTPSTLFMFIGFLFLGFLIIRLVFPALFTTQSDFVLTLLLIIYIISLLKFFVVRG